MASTESPFVEDADIEQNLQEQSRRGQSPSPLARIPAEPLQSDLEFDEAAPLLSSSNDRDGTSGQQDDGTGEWFGYAEFEGLPWWKRPSVRTLPPTL